MSRMEITLVGEYKVICDLSDGERDLPSNLFQSWLSTFFQRYIYTVLGNFHTIYHLWSSSCLFHPPHPYRFNVRCFSAATTVRLESTNNPLRSRTLRIYFNAVLPMPVDTSPFCIISPKSSRSSTVVGIQKGSSSNRSQ
jgi:hypothetical protein